MAQYNVLNNNQYIGLYEENNTRAICKMAERISSLDQEATTIITDLIIYNTIDKTKLYEAHDIEIHYNDSRYISIVDYIEDIIVAVNNKNIAIVNDLLNYKNTVKFNIAVKRIKAANNTIENQLQSLKAEIKNIDAQLDKLDDLYKQIQNSRKSKGYSLAIYKCNDDEAIQLIEINNKMDMLESKQDAILKEYKELHAKKYSIESLALHENFKTNKYEIILDNDYNNKIHTNDKDLYINQAKETNSSIEVREYIEYNNNINHECNKPYLKTIYIYDSKYDIYYHADINQLNYKDYKQVWTNSKGDILQLVENGYTNNNEEIYTRIINMFNQEMIFLHKPFSSSSYCILSKYKHSDKYYYTIGTIRHFVLDKLTKDIQDIINNLLDKLKANKSYKYDIEYIKDFIFI